MPKLQSTDDGRLMYKTSYEGCKTVAEYYTSYLGHCKC